MRLLTRALTTAVAATAFGVVLATPAQADHLPTDGCVSQYAEKAGDWGFDPTMIPGWTVSISPSGVVTVNPWGTILPAGAIIGQEYTKATALVTCVV